jgi:hypothetical protein
MELLGNNLDLGTSVQKELFPRPSPRELPYMIDILKEMGKITCEEEYSEWIKNLYHENKLSLVSNVMKLVYLITSHERTS